MTRGALSVVSLLFVVSACGDGPIGPEEQSSPEVIIEGYVTSSPDGSPLQGATVRATIRESYSCDIDFCSYRTVTMGSAETDNAGHYQMVLPTGCVDIQVSKIGFIQTGEVPLRYCTPGTSFDPPSDGLRVDLRMRPQEPTVVIQGRVTSSVDGSEIYGVHVGVYAESDEDRPLTWDPTSVYGDYSLSLGCQEVLYVQAECVETPFPYTNCTGWKDSERLPIRSECPGPGSPAVQHRVDFVLDPVSE